MSFESLAAEIIWRVHQRVSFSWNDSEGIQNVFNWPSTGIHKPVIIPHLATLLRCHKSHK